MSEHYLSGWWAVLKRFGADESGLAKVEYSMIAVAILLGIIAVAGNIGHSLGRLYEAGL